VDSITTKEEGVASTTEVAEEDSSHLIRNNNQLRKNQSSKWLLKFLMKSRKK